MYSKDVIDLMRRVAAEAGRDIDNSTHQRHCPRREVFEIYTKAQEILMQQAVWEAAAEELKHING